jgi:hypothetical protein
LIAEPVTKHFTVPQGADFPIRTKYTIDNVVLDITGATVRGAIKKSHNTTSVVLSFTQANANVYLNAATGFFGIDFKSAATSAIPAGVYVYDIELVLASGEVTRVLQGNITLTPEVTV